MIPRLAEAPADHLGTRLCDPAGLYRRAGRAWRPGRRGGIVAEVASVAVADATWRRDSVAGCRVAAVV